MESKKVSDINTNKKSLVLSLIVGMSANAILAALTMEAVSLSIFPFITLVLATQNLYQDYLKVPTAEDLPLVGVACFFLGLFGHSAFIKATTPGADGNFFAIVVSLALLVWVGKKLGYFESKSDDKTAE